MKGAKIMEENKKQKGNKGLQKTFFYLFLILFVLGLVALIYIVINSYLPQRQNVVSGSSATSTQSEAPLPENPIDFATLKATNSDVYAWIRIPGTVIDYPVLQATDQDDDFYLNHDLDKKYKFAGSIYSEKKNSKDFSDRNTVLYGHNMLNGTMFQNLHKFRNADFFEENQYIYIYTPGHILTYKIIAAYKYDSRHLLNTFDYSDNTVFKDYLDYIKNPSSMMVNKREAELDLNSKILTLSTCIGDEKDYRYLVQGVLIKDEPTK